MKKPSWQAGLLGLAFILCLLQLWLPQYYITGDGPCHVYNSKLLHDFWAGEHLPFYSRFYDLLKEPSPNWFGHIIMAALMFVCSPVVAEKIFLTIYIVVFITGFYKLIRCIDPLAGSWVLVIPLLVFQHPLLKGFYNFSMGIGLFCWMLYAFFLMIKKPDFRHFLVLFLATLLCYFAHPSGIFFGWILEGLLLICFLISRRRDPGKSLKNSVKLVAGLTVCNLPFLVLVGRFILHQGAGAFDASLNPDRLPGLFRFDYLVTRTHHEVVWISIAVFVLLALVVVGAILVFRRKGSYVSAAVLLGLFLTLLVYVSVPDWLLGGGMMVMRAQIYFYVIAFLFVAAAGLPGLVKNAGALIIYCCALVLISMGIPGALKASEGVETFMSVAPYIKPESLVFTLNFSPAGLTPERKDIADRNWLFGHVTQYIGALKPAILMDNYEANTGYFPLYWKDRYNPFRHLNAEEGIEGLPPYAQLEEYNKAQPIRYVILWGYDDSWYGKGHVKQLFEQLNRSYQKIYETVDKRVILYEIRQ